MTITFTPLHPVIGAECGGVDISRSLTKQEAAAIDAGMDRYAVLVFRQGTPLTTEQQLAFTLNFGEQEAPYTQIQAAQGMRWTNPALSDISNISPSGGLLDRDDRKRLSGLGNQMWHSDSSYKAVPARYSLLSATCCHRRAATRSSPICAPRTTCWSVGKGGRIEDLVCEHSRIFSKGALGIPFTEKELPISPRSANVWCARIARPAANRCICHRMPAASSVGRRRKPKSCCEN